MNRSALSMIFLVLALLAGPAHALRLGEEASWIDKTLPPALQEKLSGIEIWKRVPASLQNFSPRPEEPLAIKTACAEKTPSVFYTELIERGVTVLRVEKCAQLLLWIAAGDKGLTYTFEELQKKFLPLDNEAEAIAFLIALGGNALSTWYGATLDGVIYLMTDESYCRGLGHLRKIYRTGTDGRSRMIGSVIDPAPKNSGCTLNMK